MSTRLHLVVGCTDSKRFAPEQRLLLRDIAGTQLTDRASAWIARLEQAERVTTARDLYKGDAWRRNGIVESVAQSQGFDVTTWLCSAGYGLLDMNAPVASYGATFAAGHADSVAAGAGARDGRSTWWNALAEWAGPTPGAPRTLAELVKDDPSASLLLVLSPPYLDAVAADLEEAARISDDPSRVAAISVGARLNHDYVVHTDSRIQYLVGGALQSINPRVAALLLESAAPPVSRQALARRAEEFTASLPPRPTYDHRSSIDDEAIKKFISDAFRAGAAPPKTSLLRELRDGGSKCEQKRFGRLYDQVVETIS